MKPVPDPPELSLGARVLLLTSGWLLLLVGIAGLFLPGIQGLLAIALALGLLSAGSKRFHGWLRRALRRWPRLWAHVEDGRKRVHRWFGPRAP